MKVYSLLLMTMYSYVALGMENPYEKEFGTITTYANCGEDAEFAITYKDMVLLRESKTIAEIVDSVNDFGIDKPNIVLPIVSAQEYQNTFIPYLRKIHNVGDDNQKKIDLKLELVETDYSLLLKIAGYAHYFDISDLERYAVCALSKKLTNEKGMSLFFNNKAHCQQISNIVPHLSQSLVSHIVEDEQAVLQDLFFQPSFNSILQKTLENKRETFDLVFGPDDSLACMPPEKTRSCLTKSFFVWEGQYTNPQAIQSNERHGVEISFLSSIAPIASRNGIILLNEKFKPSKIFYLSNFCTMYRNAESNKTHFLKDNSKAAMNSLAISPSKELIASSNVNKEIFVWRYDGTLVRSWLKDTDSFEGGRLSLAFHPYEHLLATGRCQLRLLDIDDGTWRTGDKSIHGISGLLFSPDGKMLVASSSNKIYVNKVKTLQKKRELTDVKPPICIAFSNDSSLLASGNYNTIKLWNPKKGYCIKTITFTTNISTSALAFNANDTLLAAGFSDSHKIHVYTLDKFKKFLDESRRLTLPQILLLLGSKKAGSSFDPNDEKYAHFKDCYTSLNRIRRFLGKKSN